MLPPQEAHAAGGFHRLPDGRACHPGTVCDLCNRWVCVRVCGHAPMWVVVCLTTLAATAAARSGDCRKIKAGVSKLQTLLPSNAAMTAYTGAGMI